MAIGNRFELIDGQELQGQDCLNVYFYKQTAGAAGSAEDLIGAWETNILPKVLAIQSNRCLHVGTISRNLDNPLDFFALLHLPGIPGGYVSAAEPVFVAASFVMKRRSLATRDARKRYPGVPDQEVVDGLPTPSYVAACGQLSNVLDDDILGFSGGVYRPVIMKRLLDATGHLIGYQEYEMAQGFFTGITTQNTRKPGVGA